MVKLEDVDSLTIPKLKAELRELGVKGYSGKKSAELKTLLKKELRKKSPKKKSPRKKSPRKSPTKTPEVSAKDFKLGTVELGRDGDVEYEVMKDKNGNKRWRRCDASTASCEVSPVKPTRTGEYSREELEAMKATPVQELLNEESKAVAKEIANAEGRKRNNKQDNIAAILRVQTRAGKQRVKEIKKVVGKDVEVEPMPAGRELLLDGWTVVGELEPAFLFLRGFEEDRLVERIENDNKDGLVRFEPDPNCVNNCGAQVLCVDVSEGAYPLETKANRGYLQEVKVGELKGATKTRADFFFQGMLLIGKLDALYYLMRGVDNVAEFKERVLRSRYLAVIESKSLAKPKRMFLNFRGPRGTDGYKGFYVQKAE